MSFLKKKKKKKKEKEKKEEEVYGVQVNSCHAWYWKRAERERALDGKLLLERKNALH